MLRQLTFLASIIFVGNHSAAHVPIPVPQAVQRAYAVSDMKQGHFDDAGKQHIVVDSGTLYAMKNTSVYAQIEDPIVENVVEHGGPVSQPLHVGSFKRIFGPPREKINITQGELYYLSDISAEGNGLAFTFTSFNLWYVVPEDYRPAGPMSKHVRIRFVMTPAQLAALTPEAMKQMTDKFFAKSTVSVHEFVPLPD